MGRSGELAFKLICPPFSWIIARSVVAGTSQGCLCRGAAMVMMYHQLRIASGRVLWLLVHLQLTWLEPLGVKPVGGRLFDLWNIGAL